MRRFAVPAVIIAVAIVLLVVLASGVFTSGANNSIAYSVASKQYRIPPKDEAELPLIGASEQKTLAQFRGRFVLVNFFASWCEQCELESSVLAQAQREMAAHHGTVVGITFQTPTDAASTYMRKYGVDYPVLTDPAGDVAGAWGISGVPDSYLIDPQGRIVWLNLYQLTPSFVNQTLPRLMDQFA